MDSDEEMAGLFVFRFSFQLLTLVSISAWRLSLKNLKYLRTRPVVRYYLSMAALIFEIGEKKIENKRVEVNYALRSHLRIHP